MTTRNSYQLERTRNNQRRSRARKREYVAALEARIREYEETRAQQASHATEADTVEKLQQENARLSRLLEALGINTEFQDAYLGASGSIPSSGGPSLPAQALGQETINPLQGGTPTSTLAVGNQQESMSCPRFPPLVTSNELSCQGTSLSAVSEPALSLDEWMQNPLVNASIFPASTPLIPDMVQSHGFHSVAPNPNPISLVTQLQTASPDGLTPCSLAYSLVYRYNRKGHNTAYLNFRLYVGYRECTVISDECAVENKVLFGVLADIS
ncbi:bZIP transcription factor [Aspergillus tanneri]|uniref:BZIP domain-containing protein n=1 Tax=Aspergillus tanneri TaxID=1220188 RepID=A0A5M9N4F3_9EURO|nr:uncharacterized protein ATNIH1004_002118 [Aspergillus tanneri]KAA8649447.1 hypothetical protein ATNIH1004_002118 [Aspergillus tanneri]